VEPFLSTGRTQTDHANLIRSVGDDGNVPALVDLADNDPPQLFAASFAGSN